jgi:hypothetical protein
MIRYALGYARYARYVVASLAAVGFKLGLN